MCVCVCVCVWVRGCVHACVCVYIVIVKYFPCIWAVFSSGFMWVVDVLLILLNVFYVNDEPESKFLYTETIKLYCIKTAFYAKNYSLWQTGSWTKQIVHRHYHQYLLISFLRCFLTFSVKRLAPYNTILTVVSAVPPLVWLINFFLVTHWPSLVLWARQLFLLFWKRWHLNPVTCTRSIRFHLIVLMKFNSQSQSGI